MYVANLEPGALTCQTSRPKSRYTTLVGDLGQRIVLIHELRQLTGSKKLLDGRSDGFGIDHILRHQAFRIRHTKPLFNCAFNPYESHPESVFSHFSYRPDTPISEVINVVNGTEAVTDRYQSLEHVNDVINAQHRVAFRVSATQPAIELHSANRRKIIALCRKEQIGK